MSDYSEYIVEHIDPEEWEYEILLLQSTILPDDSIVHIFGGEWWLLFHKSKPNEPVAFASMHPSVTEPDSWFLSRSGVLPEHTGKGLQKLLINARLDLMKEKGITKAITYTSYDNPASSNNLIGCGFKLYRPEHLYAGEDSLYWRKILDKE